jgi:hypothetical protein
MQEGMQDLETLQGNHRIKVILSWTAEIRPATRDRVVDNDMRHIQNMHMKQSTVFSK